MTSRNVATLSAGFAAAVTFAFVQYLGDDRAFSEDVNFTACLFAALVAALAYRVARRRSR